MLCCAIALALVGLPLSALRACLKPPAASPLSWRLVPSCEAVIDLREQQYGALRAFLRTRARSFVYAAAGVSYVVRNEQSCVIHAAATVAVIACGWWLDISREDWRWIAVALAAVWSAEAFNTAIERTCDVLSPQYSAHVRVAKDAAAGAVLLVSIGAAIAGLLTFWPYLAVAGGEREILPAFDISICRTVR